MEYDFKRLRRDLMEDDEIMYAIGEPLALFGVVKIETASEQELLKIAKKRHINLKKYEKKKWGLF